MIQQHIFEVMHYTCVGVVRDMCMYVLYYIVCMYVCMYYVPMYT